MDTDIKTIELRPESEHIKVKSMLRYGDYKPPIPRTPTNIIAVVAASVIAFGVAVTAITVASVSYSSLQNVKSTVGGESATVENLAQAQNILRQNLETLNITFYQTIQEFNVSIDANLTNTIRELIQILNTTLDNLQSEFSNITETFAIISNYSISARNSAIDSQQYSQDSLTYSQNSYNSSILSAISSNISTEEAQLSEYYANVSKIYYEDVSGYLEQVKHYYNISVDLLALINGTTVINEGLANNVSISALMALMYANQSQEYADQSQNYSNSSLSYFMMTAFSYNQSTVLLQEMEDLFSNFNQTIQYIINSGILSGNLTNSTAALLYEAIQAANQTLGYMSTTHGYLLQVQELANEVQSNSTTVYGYLQQVIELTAWSQENASLSHNYSIDSQNYAALAQYYADYAYNITQNIGTNGTVSFTGLKIGDGQIVFLNPFDTTIKATAPAQNSTILIPDPQSTNSSFVLTTGSQTVDTMLTFTGDITFDSLDNNTVLITDDSNHLTKLALDNSDIVMGSPDGPTGGKIIGTSDQVYVTYDGTNQLTLSTPQSINTTSTPTFSTVKLPGLSNGASSFIFLDETGTVNVRSDIGDGNFLMAWSSGADNNQVAIGSLVSDTDTISISFFGGPVSPVSRAKLSLDLPQSIATTASPTFDTVKLSGLSDGNSTFIYLDDTGNVNVFDSLQDGDFLMYYGSLGINNKIVRGRLTTTTGTILINLNANPATLVGDISLDLPQAIDSDASPIFNDMTINGAFTNIGGTFFNGSSNIFTSGLQIGLGASYISYLDFKYGTVTATTNNMGSSTIDIDYYIINDIATITSKGFTTSCGGGTPSVNLPSIINPQAVSPAAAQVQTYINLSGDDYTAVATVNNDGISIVPFGTDSTGKITTNNSPAVQTCKIYALNIVYPLTI